MSEQTQQTAAAASGQKIDIVTSLERITAILLTAVVVFFLFLRANNAGALWRDEAASLQLAQLPTIGDIAANFQHEAFPIPFPLVVRGYSAIFGSADATLRWFGFAVGVALIIAGWFSSRSLADRGPLLFLSLLGLNATFLLWGTSLRGYGIGCVFLVLTIGFTVRAISVPRFGNAIAATIAAIAAVQFMANAVPLIGAISAAAFLVFALQKQFRRATVVGFSATICALSFLPYLRGYLSANWNVVLIYPTDFASLSEKLHSALAEHSTAIFWYAVVAITIPTAIWNWWRSRQKPSTAAQLFLFLVAVVVLSIFAYYVFLKVLSYATRPWYYLPLLCTVAAAIDLTGAVLSRAQWFRLTRLIISIAALSFLPFKLWNVGHERLTDIDLVTRKLEEQASPNDLIVLNPWHYAPSFYRYYHGATPWITVPTMTEHRVHRYDLMKAKMMETDPLSDVRAAIRQTLQSGHRVWVVGGARPLDPAMPQLGPAPNPYFGWAGYMSYWSMEIGSFLGEHAATGQVLLEPMPGVNDGENLPLLVANGWKD